MARGRTAPLSPNEEVTLRRIALGISQAKQLPTHDVDYLVRLRLVDDDEGRLKLTDLGRERYQALPRPAAISDVTNTDETVTVLRHLILGAGDR
jgi:hypothetical protein